MQSLLKAGLTLAVGSLVSLSSFAADINWDGPANITGDSDVSTKGTLLGALNFNGPDTTINGVTFQSLLATTNSNTVGNFNLSSGFFFGGTDYGSMAAPFSLLSPSYRALVGTGADAGSMTLTMSGLTVGKQYQFQVWANDSHDYTALGFDYTVFVNGGNNGVPLDPNTTLQDGGLGQYVIGTFTADSATQTVDFTSEVAIVNGFQLRLLDAATPGGPGPSVPLPPAVYPGIAMATTLIARRLRRKA